MAHLFTCLSSVSPIEYNLQNLVYRLIVVSLGPKINCDSKFSVDIAWNKLMKSSGSSLSLRKVQDFIFSSFFVSFISVTNDYKEDDVGIELEILKL